MSRLLLFLSVTSACLARADYMDHYVLRDDVGVHKAPALGDTKVVLIPVEVAGFPAFDRTALEAFFAPTGVFVRYFETASLGRYRPRVTVAPTVRYAQCPLPADVFPGCAIGRGDLSAVTTGMTLMEEVLRKADEAGLDFARFDVNGKNGKPDRWVDGVMLLINTPFGGIGFPFAYFNDKQPLIIDGVKIGHLAIAGDSDKYVMVHEFGHLLGLTDLYDESGSYDGLFLSFMGAWYYDPQIPLPDAETRFRLRWGNWHQVQGTQQVRIAPVETSGQVYRLGVGDEYFLVENRGPGGQFDQRLPERGLAIFHVDRGVKLSGEEGTFINRIIDCVNCDPWHPYIGLQQADGKHEIEAGGNFGAGDLYRTGATFEGTLYDGGTPGLKVSHITVNDDGTIDATLEAPASGQCDETLCASGEGCAPVTCGPTPPKSGCAVSPALVPVLALLLLEERLRRRQQRVARRA